MKIDLGKDFLNAEGEILDGETKCCVINDNGKFAHNTNGTLLIKIVPTPDLVLNLKKVCIDALLAEYPNEQTDPTEKYDKYVLFRKFHKADKTVEIDSKQMELAKKWIAKHWNTLVMGQAFDMLEGK